MNKSADFRDARAPEVAPMREAKYTQAYQEDPPILHRAPKDDDLPEVATFSHATQRRPNKRYLIAVAIIAIAIGLGAGVGIGWGAKTPTTLRSSELEQDDTQQGTCPTLPTSPTETAAAITAGSTGVVPSDCDANNPEYNAAPDNTTFIKECGKEYLNGVDTEVPGVRTNRTAAMIAYSFAECINLCVAINSFKTCRAVVFAPNLTEIRLQGANCWLKNARGLRQGDKSDRVAAYMKS